MSSIKTVTLVGGSGSLGSVVLQKLLASEFDVQVIRRTGSKATFPDTVKVVDVDISSVEALTAALTGQDAVVSTVSDFLAQIPLIDAALAAGVKRILPSEFGCDLDHPKVAQLPVFGHKVQVVNYLREKCPGSALSYTLVRNCAFLDWGVQYNFIINYSEYKPSVFGSGDTTFSATSLASVADAVVGVLRKPEETKDRAVYVEDTKLTQNKLVEIGKQVAPEKPWAVTSANLDDVTAAADARLAKGIIDAETMVPYLFRAIFDESYGSNWEKTDNELLGLKGKTDDEVAAIVKQYIK
ncbi:hypothetical protein B0I35DRAFT_111245 [Stachybotrys elegans]|uniref:NmrA-like domain-containing protein n=1 Tax=Stachybotrys elegans TaxID=80388 RepID=A0A8K0SGY1_9HYPO|nr:hypothetical protein B0I35DRAFT_111245 [Stachybotrys elegans]